MPARHRIATRQAAHHVGAGRHRTTHSIRQGDSFLRTRPAPRRSYDRLLDRATHRRNAASASATAWLSCAPSISISQNACRSSVPGRRSGMAASEVDTSGRKCGGARVGRGPIGRQLAVGDGMTMTTLAGKDERLARGQAQRRPRDERSSRSPAEAERPAASARRSPRRVQPVGGLSTARYDGPVGSCAAAELGHSRSRKALEGSRRWRSVRPVVPRHGR